MLFSCRQLRRLFHFNLSFGGVKKTNLPHRLFANKSTIENAKNSWDKVKLKSKSTKKQILGHDSFLKPSKLTPIDQCTSLDTLMGMTGLETVKQSFLDIFYRVDIAIKQGLDFGNTNMNIRLDGNPGTGKTTVANLYASFLIQVGVLPKTSSVTVTSGIELKNGQQRHLDLLLDNVKKAGGGVIIIDEAYQLDDREGHKVLDFVLSHSEKLNTQYGPLVWVLAGTTKKLDKLLEYNMGLHSRFPHRFHFEDFSNKELLSIWDGLLSRCGRDINQPTSKLMQLQVNPIPEDRAKSFIDRWGVVWRYDRRSFSKGRWRDDYDNYTDKGQVGLGTDLNPLQRKVNRVVLQYTFSESEMKWVEQKGGILPVYPHSTVPAGARHSTFSETPVTIHTTSNTTASPVPPVNTQSASPPPFVDPWGNRWFFSESHQRWYDPKGNYSLYGEKDLGSAANPIMTGEKGRLSAVWLYHSPILVFYNVLNPTADLVFLNLCLDSPKKLPVRILGFDHPATCIKPADCFIDQWSNKWSKIKGTDLCKDQYGNFAIHRSNDLGTATNPIHSERRKYVFDAARGVFHEIENPNLHRIKYPSTNEVKKYTGELPPPPPTEFQFSAVDEKWSRIAMRRLGRGRGREGFGNARSVRNLFDLTLKRQSARLTSELDHEDTSRHPDEFGLFALSREDVLGPKASFNILNNCSAWTELQAMEGLGEVKEAVRQLLEVVIQNADREDDEKPLLHVALNRIFLGNPGTGKTTVAKLYARILADLGLLSKGEVIVKVPSDFKGAYVGHSEAQTRAILESAMGSVLVIDEAYGLNPATKGSFSPQDPFNKAIIQTIVEQVQGVPGEDRAVVLLGYKNEMESLLTNANPGLARRFQMENAFVFTDYDDEALVRILKSAVEAVRLTISEDTAVHAIKQLAKAKALPNFGNAGAVNNLLSEAKLRMQSRQKLLAVHMRTDVLIDSDFTAAVPSQTEDELFADLVGCEAIRSKLKQIEQTVKFAKRRGKLDPRTMCDFNYVFSGAPGTGKTTVARLMGKMFCKLGLIPCDEVVEISASDLVTGFVGQAGQKTREMFTKARGKVLFIDEAYQLNPKHGGGYMQEVVDEIVKCLTSEEFQGKIVVILAGYEHNMQEMLGVNPGLKSRFSERIHFEDFSSEATELLLRKIVAKEGLSLSDEADKHLAEVAERLTQSPSFGNGRDVNNFYKRLFSAIAARCMSDNNEVSTELVEMCDLNNALQLFLKARSPSQTVPLTKER